MLTYLGSGARYYAEKPVPLMQRPYWEFQAVLSGRIAMTDGKSKNPLREKHLWLSRPGHLHGWTGEPDTVAEIVVFHFESLPDAIERRVPASGALIIPLPEGQEDRLRLLARQVGRYLHTPAPEMLLRFEHTLLELSLMVFEAAEERLDTHNAIAKERVHRAINWYTRHMKNNPGLEEVSLAAGASPAHLRRHFHDIMRASPKKVFDQIRFQRAIQMMASPDSKLGQVSEQCGFESQSSFSRAFKKKFGVCPEQWRI